MLLLALIPVLLSAAAADCSAPHDVDRWQLLRRLSLDLRGRVPSMEEYAALDQAPDVSKDTLEGWLKTDDFRAAMRRYHESMFWPNVSRVRLTDTNNSLATLPNSTDPGLYITSTGRQRLYRTGADGGCGPNEQTHFDPAFPNEFRPDPAFVSTTTVNGVTVKQEGWRLVSPYWAPGTQVKVCAYDAQESAQAKLASGATVSCADKAGESAAGCGCGPGLEWCYAPGGMTSQPILRSLREQLDRSVDDVSTGGKPYTDLLLSTSSWQNGAIAYWKKNLAPHYAIGQTFDLPDPGEPLSPAPDFNDSTWTQVQRPGLHAGVLTLPGYLLRFQTDRGRANRFRINFLCTYFVPPDHLEDASGGACQDNGADITQRCNCRYCHSVLEPLAAHWGLFAMAGTTQTTDPGLFPKSNTSCKGSSSAFCARFYVTQPDAHNPGALQAYQFADVHPEIVANIEGGPRLLAQQAVDTGQLAQCTVRKLWVHLNNAEIYDAAAPATPVLDELATGFAAQGYSLPWLVEQIVSRPEYRRAR